MYWKMKYVVALRGQQRANGRFRGNDLGNDLRCGHGFEAAAGKRHAFGDGAEGERLEIRTKLPVERIQIVDPRDLLLGFLEQQGFRVDVYGKYLAV